MTASWPTTNRPAEGISITPAELLRLANLHEPEASASPPSYRMATCVRCGRRMARMWHLWLHDGGFKKEIHLCRRCGKHYR